MAFRWLRRLWTVSCCNRTCMHWTLPPLLAREVMSAVLRVVGKAELDLRPVNGATMLAWAGAVRLTAMVALDSMEEAISFFTLCRPPLSSELLGCLWTSTRLRDETFYNMFPSPWTSPSDGWGWMQLVPWQMVAVDYASDGARKSVGYHSLSVVTTVAPARGIQGPTSLSTLAT